MKSAGADRLDLGAQPIERVAMDARQQRRSHHSSVCRVGAPVRVARTAAQHHAFGFEREQRAHPHRRLGRRAARQSAAAVDRAGDASAGRATARRSRRRASRLAQRATPAVPRSADRPRAPDGSAQQLGKTLGRDDDDRASPDAGCRRRGTPARRDAISCRDQLGPTSRQLARGQEAGGQQRVVQLVGVARVRTRFLAHARDRGRIERAEIVRRRRLARRAWRSTAWLRRSSSGASSRNAYGLALRISCAKQRRLRRVARDQPELAAMDARRARPRSPSKSIASSRQSRTVWLTSG